MPNRYGVGVSAGGVSVPTTPDDVFGIATPGAIEVSGGTSPPGTKRHVSPADSPPRLSVPMSRLWPPLTKTLGRSATAVGELATGPAATVKYCPAGTPSRLKWPASSVRALMELFCRATSTAPAGKPLDGIGRWPGTACAFGAFGTIGVAGCPSGEIG